MNKKGGGEMFQIRYKVSSGWGRGVPFRLPRLLYRFRHNLSKIRKAKGSGINRANLLSKKIKNFKLLHDKIL